MANSEKHFALLPATYWLARLAGRLCVKIWKMVHAKLAEKKINAKVAKGEFKSLKDKPDGTEHSEETTGREDVRAENGCLQKLHTN